MHPKCNSRKISQIKPSPRAKTLQVKVLVRALILMSQHKTRWQRGQSPLNLGWVGSRSIGEKRRVLRDSDILHYKLCWHRSALAVFMPEHKLVAVFFFPCLAGLVRDLVGQQLEWTCDWKQISPKKETKNHPTKQTTTTTHTHRPRREPGKSQGNLQTKWNQVKHARPSQPLKCSRPPCSTPSRCPIVRCQPYQCLLLDTQ